MYGLSGSPMRATGVGSVRMVSRYGHWIGGRSVEPVTGSWIESTRPSTSDIVCEIAAGTAADVDAAVRAAAGAAERWRCQKPIDRGRLLMRVAESLRDQSDDLAALEVAESGKPDFMGGLEIGLSADYFEFYAGLVNLERGEVLDTGPGYHSYTLHEPFGVVGVITPWNAPMNQAARATAPALAAGNTVVIKPSEMTSATTLELARLATEAGFPDGVFNVVTGTGEAAGEPLVEHPLVRKIAFTGSVRAGRQIGKVAAERIIPVTLELGGKSANIVFSDADIDAAVQGSLMAFIGNTGQTCSNGTRLLVQADIHDRFVEQLVAAAEQSNRFMGNLTTQAQHEKVKEYLAIAEQEGAVAATGGRVSDEWIPEPTVYIGVQPRMRIAREEIFGPVVVVMPFEDEDEAVAMANDSDYGLAAGLWTQDLSRAHRLASRLEAGQIFVNTWGAGIEIPFGGYKQSGIGREKGIEALRHYTQVKSVTVALSSATAINALSSAASDA